jgi:hypothetical protein
MNKGSDCQAPLASFSLKPIKKLWGTGEVDLRTLASGHDRGRGEGMKQKRSKRYKSRTSRPEFAGCA